MSSMTIKTKPHSYFYSDSIHLGPGSSKSVVLDSLSPTEMNDIYEGLFILETLEGDGNKEAFKAFYNSKIKSGGSSGGGGSGTGENTTTIINTETKVLSHWETEDW